MNQNLNISDDFGYSVEADTRPTDKQRSLTLKKFRKNFYLSENIADLLREYSYKTRKPQSQIVEEAIKLLKEKMDSYPQGNSTQAF